MAINQNHISEELNNIKCAIVEKNVSAERADFLKKLLVYNKYSVEIAASPPPKTGPPPAAPEADTAAPPTAPPPETFTIGVTDMMFNPINAIYGRLLHTPDGHIVTAAYWHQQETSSHDEIPYYEKK